MHIFKLPIYQAKYDADDGNEETGMQFDGLYNIPVLMEFIYKIFKPIDPFWFPFSTFLFATLE